MLNEQSQHAGCRSEKWRRIWQQFLFFNALVRKQTPPHARTDEPEWWKRSRDKWQMSADSSWCLHLETNVIK